MRVYLFFYIVSSQCGRPFVNGVRAFEIQCTTLYYHAMDPVSQSLDALLKESTLLSAKIKCAMAFLTDCQLNVQELLPMKVGEVITFLQSQPLSSPLLNYAILLLTEVHK
jgi:hypothetical protein